jgi:hypothetical protein
MQEGQVDALHPPLPEPPLEDVEPPVLDEPLVLEVEPGMHEPFTHVPFAIVQSVHIPPPVPQAMSTPV